MSLLHLKQSIWILTVHRLSIVPTLFSWISFEKNQLKSSHVTVSPLSTLTSISNFLSYVEYLQVNAHNDGKSNEWNPVNIKEKSKTYTTREKPCRKVKLEDFYEYFMWKMVVMCLIHVDNFIAKQCNEHNGTALMGPSDWVWWTEGE